MMNFMTNSILRKLTEQYNLKYCETNAVEVRVKIKHTETR